jgi:predicted PurR-regulated permease PerM
MDGVLNFEKLIIGFSFDRYAHVTDQLTWLQRHLRRPFGSFAMKQPERWSPVRAAIYGFYAALIYGTIKFFRAPAWKSRRNLWADRLRPMRPSDMAGIVPSDDDLTETSPVKEPGGPPVSEAPADEQVEMPLPYELGSTFQGGLFVLALLAALYAAREIVLPVVLAFILNLLLQPALRMLERVRVPKMLGALLLIGLLFGTVVAFGTALSGPAGTWAAKLPEGVPRLQEHLSFLRTPIETVRQFLQQAEGYVSGDTPSPAGPPQAPTIGAGLWTTLFAGTRAFVGGFFETILVLFFLLLSGDTFLRRLVEILPRFSDKRQAIEISQHIEHDISAYLITVTIMNAAVGLATALAMWLCGLGDPILWGAVAFLLNYVPILGPIIGLMTFTLAGLLTVNTLWYALLPAALYLVVHLIEGETITPMLLARRFTLNPVLVIMALIFWYWMWGVPGAILAVPMLAITKIICDRIRMLSAFGHFLEG